MLRHAVPSSRPIRRLRSALAALVIVAAAAACSDGTGPGGGTPGLRIIRGSDATDTVQAVLAQALVVELRDGDGRPVPKAVVRFEAVPTTNPDRRWEATATLSRLDQQPVSMLAADTTDGEGRAKALVRLGSIAGAVQVTVKVPEFGLVDTARFTVTPGQASRVLAAVQDTMVFPGSTYALAATVRDRFGNPRATDPVTYSLTSPYASVDATGTVTAKASGRAMAFARSGTVVDTVRVAVVPRGTLAAVVNSGGGAYAIATLELDGGKLTPLASSTSNVLLPSWNADGTRIAFQEGGEYYDARIHSVDLQGTRTPLVTAAPGTVTQFEPRYSADGQWLYFTARRQVDYYSSYAIWRARADGTSAAELLAPSGASDRYSDPGPSPDGKKLAFVANGIISVMDLATGAVTSLFVPGRRPRYSPDGARILYVGGDYGPLKVMNADGTGIRTLAPESFDSYAMPTWSPDGQWIAARGWSGLVLVSAETGESLPLKFGSALYQPAFKP